MAGFAYPLRCAALILSAALCAWPAGAALGAVIGGVVPPSPPPALSAGTPSGEPSFGAGESIAVSQLSQAVAHGRWRSACALATRLLAQKVADIDALGTFALCAAVRDDKGTVEKALRRLVEAEAAPRYYEQLVRGVVLLNGGAPDKASAVLATALRTYPGDPLVLYFSGEASRARGKVAEAITSFESVLAVWPEYAPALSAIAHLSTPADVSSASLQTAITLAERAASIEPGNLAYWQQLANLCERAGEHGRASAIKLQWMTPRVPH